jgi:hypothetical protein
MHSIDGLNAIITRDRRNIILSGCEKYILVHRARAELHDGYMYTYNGAHIEIKHFNLCKSQFISLLQHLIYQKISKN